MKYSIDTYPLYKDEKRFAFVVRAKMRMKEPVEVDVLRAAANKAIKRYPYFAVKVEVDESGSYVLINLLAGKSRKINHMAWVICAMFLLRIVVGTVIK